MNYENKPQHSTGKTSNNERNNNNNNKKMMNTPKEADFPLKKEANNTSRDHERPKASSTSLSSSQWLKPKQDPRIVRVSRAFGGKDRHSKVFTIRGLRDRRVRLSVPTAIHLYDLQNRLGLNQPSKVFDWLLNAAKHEIDELPPLPIPQGNFTLGYNFPSHHDHQVNSKKVICDHDHDHEDKQVGANVNLQNNNLLPRPNHPSFLGMLNTMPSLGYQWELSNNASSSSNLGNHIGILTQSDVHNINVVPFNNASTLSLATGGTSASQIYVCNPNGELRQQPYFSSIMEMDIARQMNNHHHHYHQLLSSSSDSQNLLANSLNQSQHQADKDEDFPSK